MNRKKQNLIISNNGVHFKCLHHLGLGEPPDCPEFTATLGDPERASSRYTKFVDVRRSSDALKVVIGLHNFAEEKLRSVESLSMTNVIITTI